MRENCKQKRTRPTPIRRILECRPLCGLKGSGLNSASFLLRRTPSQHSRGIASKVSVYLFVSPSSYSSKLFLTSLVSLSLSLSLPNVLESCHWIAFHRFHASSLGALIGHLSIQLQLKLSFRVHRWHSPPSSCRSVESLTNLQKQSNSSKPRRFDFDHSPLPLVSCVQTLEQTFNLSKKYSKIMQTHGFLTVLWFAFRPSVLSVTIVRMCLGVSMQKIEQMQSNCIFWNGTIAILSSFFRVHRVHPVEQYSQRSSNQSASAKWTYEVHAKHLHLDFSWTIGNKD